MQYSIINVSDLKGEKRLDAEFFKPIYIELENRLKELKTFKLGKYTTSIKCGPFGSTIKKETYQANGVIVARPFNINNFQFEYNDIVYISKEDCIRKNLKLFNEGDLFFARVGDIKTGIVAESREITISPNIISVQIDKNRLDPYYAAVYFNSNIGELQIQRGLKVVAQPTISTSIIKNLEIITPSNIVQKEIGEILKLSIKLKNQASNLLKNATDLLEQELGLDKIRFEKPKYYSANFSEVAATRRMNAEYFSPLIKDILNQPFLKNSKPLTQLFKIVRGSSPSKYYKDGIPVIKTKNIRLPEIDRERISDYVLSTKDFTTIQENDLLLASMGVGSLGRMSYIFELEQDFIVDGTIRVLRKRDETPANYEIPTLLFLSSKVGQELIYRGIVGSTGIISLPDDFLNKIPLPQFETKFCLKISKLVKNSMLAKKQSQQLLADAKARVEQLIEEAANA